MPCSSLPKLSSLQAVSDWAAERSRASPGENCPRHQLLDWLFSPSYPRAEVHLLAAARGPIRRLQVISSGCTSSSTWPWKHRTTQKKASWCSYTVVYNRAPIRKCACLREEISTPALLNAFQNGILFLHDLVNATKFRNCLHTKWNIAKAEL